MKLVETRYISREVVKEEIEHTFEASASEIAELQRALSIIESYKSQVLPTSVTLSDWHSIEIIVDSDGTTVKALVKHGMVG